MQTGRNTSVDQNIPVTMKIDKHQAAHHTDKTTSRKGHVRICKKKHYGAIHVLNFLRFCSVVTRKLGSIPLSLSLSLSLYLCLLIQAPNLKYTKPEISCSKATLIVRHQSFQFHFIGFALHLSLQFYYAAPFVWPPISFLHLPEEI